MKRALPLLLLFLFLAACTQDASIGAVREHPIVVPDKLDVLFVIDRSHSMVNEQRALAEGLPRFMTKLQDIYPTLPSLHIGVITSDLGAGPYTIETCEGDGDGARLQNGPGVAGCQPPDAAYLVDDVGPDGQRIPNYSGSLPEALACIAAVGSDGCGFEQPLLAVRRALDGSVARNAGFLRDDAFLTVVFLTDEDDCSASDPEALFDPMTSTLGAFGSWRCTRWGISCQGRDLDHAGTFSGCEPRAGDAYVTHTASFVGYLSLKKDPRAIHIAVVAGPPSPVTVTSEGGPLRLAPSCFKEGGGPALPATRLEAFARSFPSSSFHSICDEDMAEVLEALGTDVRHMITAYETDARDDLDLSYGCATAAGRTTGGGGLLAALLVLVAIRVTDLRRTRQSTSCGSISSSSPSSAPATHVRSHPATPDPTSRCASSSLPARCPSSTSCSSSTTRTR